MYEKAIHPSVPCNKHDLFRTNKNFLKEVESINFYGVDYSAAKVFGAAETPAQFKVAFDGINRLFITEAKKYDVSKKLKVRVNEISLDAVNQVNEAIDPQELMTTNASYMLSEDQIKQIVNALPTQRNRVLAWLSLPNY